MNKLFSSESFFTISKKIADALVGMTEEVIKQWLGTAIGARVLKWFIDILVTRFFDTIVSPIVRVAVIRIGYYYDLNDAKDRIKKLKNAEDSNDEELYYRTLNDILRK